MNFLRKNRLAIQLTATLALSVWLPVWFLSGPGWNAYYSRMDLGPGGIGASAQADTPVARSIADMESLDKFRVERVQTDWQDSEGGVSLDGSFYWFFTLQSGEQILIQYNLDAYEYDPDRDYWGSPIGVWRSWEPSEQSRAILAREAPNLADISHYGDMLGNHGDDELDREHFVEKYQMGATFACMALLAVLQFLVLKLLRKRGEKNMEATRTRSDLELWLTGTYAIWAQFFAGLYLRDPEAAQKHPFYIGALPKTGETVRAEKEMLSESWDINSYKDLLETVEYMSEGPGYQNCDSQAGLAWELCRSMQLLGCAYLIGWCSRKECIRRSCAVGRSMQKDFQSWEELCQGFLDGFSAWRLSGGQSPSDLAAVQQRADIYWTIRRRTDSPYNLPWNMELNPDKA